MLVVFGFGDCCYDVLNNVVTMIPTSVQPLVILVTRIRTHLRDDAKNSNVRH
jgi:hypothetical protein